MFLILPGNVFADGTCTTKQGSNQLCDLGQINLTTNIKINGQSTNLVKVGKADGSFQLEVIVTLNSPPTLTLGSTKINLTVPSSATSTVNFEGFGSVVTPSNTTSICASKNAEPLGNTLGGGFIYQNCSNPPFNYTQSNSSIAGPVFTAGQTVFDATYTVNASNLSALIGSNPQLNNGTDPNSGVNQFYAYPAVGFEFTVFNNDWNTYFNGGVGGFVQLYGTQAQANAATTQPQACTSTNPNLPAGCIPGYGGNTASGTNVSGTPTTTDKLAQFLNEIVAFVLASIQQLIYGIFFLLVSPVIVAVLGIHAYQDTFVAVIYSGWETIRNLCDIFFIVALIVIAMATLFRVESYKARHLLVQLIIAALMINFSLVIGQSILAVADTVQAQFLPADAASVNALAYKLMTTNNSSLMNYLQGQQNANASATNSSLIGGLVASVFWVALSLGSLAVFGAIAAFLVIRIIALWLLLMISPVAYAVGVLPSTAHYRDEWWKNFLKYAFFTPIMAFFLNIAALMATNATVNSQLQTAANNATIFNGQNGLASLIVTLGSNILLLVFLIASLKVADLAGIYGASGITDIAKKGIYAPFAGAAGLGKVAGGYAGRKWNEFTANKVRGSGREVSRTRAAAYAVLNPMAFGKAWSKERERKTHRATEKAEMAGLEVVQQRFDSPANMFRKHGSRKIEPHVLQLEKKEEDEASKNLQNMSRENVAQTAAEYAALANDEDGKARKRGIIKLAMSKGYIDDIIQEAHKTEEGRKMIEDMIAVGDLKEGRDYKKQMIKDAKTGKMIEVKAMEYNHDTRRSLYKTMFGWDGHHFKDHAAARLITEEGETEGMATGHLEYMTDMYFDNKTGEYKFYAMKDKDGMRVSEGEEKMAGAEIAKKDSRTQARIAWHSLMSSDGSQVYKDVLAKVVKAVAENPSFMQERTANMLVAGTTDEAVLTKVREKFLKDNVLEVDDVSAKRLETIRKTDQKAFVAIVSRFINDAEKPAIEARVTEGFKIKNTLTGTTIDADLGEAQKIATDKEDAKAAAGERAKKRQEEAKKRAAAGGGTTP
jgi:hypothetical protein